MLDVPRFKKRVELKPNYQLLNAFTAFIFTLATIFHPAAFANPEGGQVAAGIATIEQTPNTTVINQASDKAIINWQSFNINSQESVHFQQPQNGIALNRINPQQGPSQIFGQLTATGKIILVNQAGVFFGPNAYVNVGGIIASTSDISNENFLAGAYKFDHPSPYNGAVVNQGQIIVNNNGLAALIGTGVSNEGIIQARMGQVVLASGNKFTVSLDGNQLINFTVDEGATAAGKDLKSGVNNSGKILADGGSILMTARSARGVVDQAINMSGVAEARSVYQKNGEIILSATDGKIVVSNKLTASGKGTNETGGKIKVLAPEVILTEQATLDASGDMGGGEILVGGNAHGLGPEMNANYAYVGSNTLLDASAINRGNGGKVVVWSDIGTGFYGKIDARGGAVDGQGGWVETSGKIYLDAKGIVYAKDWLLDPSDVVIGNATSNGAFDNGSPNTFTPSGDNAVVDVATINAALNAGTNVTITTGASGSQQGNITVSSAIQKTSGSNTPTLTLSTQSAGNIILDNTITYSGSAQGLNLVLYSNGGNISQSAAITGTALNANANGGSIGLTHVSNSLIGSVSLATSGTGNIDFSNNSPLSVSSITAGSGNVTLYANSMNFTGGANSITGSGNLRLGGLDATTTIGVNGGAGTLSISASNLAAINNTFNQLTIGHASQSGNITLPSTTFNVSTVFHTSGNINVGGTIAASGSKSLSFDGPTILTANSAFTSGTGNISLLGALTAQGSNRSLTIATSGSGAININNTIDGNAFGSPGALSLTGIININTSKIQTWGDQVYYGPVNINTATTFTVQTADDIIFNSTINGGNDLVLNGSIDNITFNGAIGSITPLASLNLPLQANTYFNGATINTTGAQTYNGSVFLQQDTVLRSINGGGINFNFFVESPTHKNLTISNDSGSIYFNNEVGGNFNSLGSLTISTGNPTSIKDITTIGSQTYDSPVTLNASQVSLLATGSTSSIIFNDTVDGNASLIVQADSFFSNIGIGSITPLSSLVANLISDSVTLKGGVVTQGLQMYESPDVNLVGTFSGDEINFQPTNSLVETLLLGDTTFNVNSFKYAVNDGGYINGNHDLTINATSEIIIRAEDIGVSTALKNISMTSPSISLGKAQLYIDLNIITSGNQNYTGPVSAFTVSNLRMTGDNINFNGNLTTSGARVYFTTSGDSHITGKLNAMGGLYPYTVTYGGSLSEGPTTVIYHPGLIKRGSGSLTLSGDNSTSLAGYIDVQEGTLSVSHSNQLGYNSEPLILADGTTLRVTSGFEFYASKPFNFGAATIQVDSGNLLLASNPLYAPGFNALSSLNKTGAGTIEFGTGARSMSAAYINAGTIVFSSPISLGTAYLRGGNIGFNSNFSFTGLVLESSGNIDVNANVTATVNNVSNNGGITKNGLGAFNILGNSTYLGATQVNAGSLGLGHVNALGSTPTITIAAGAALELLVAGTLTNTNPITVQGAGVSNTGALKFSHVTGTTLTNAITFTNDMTIGGSGVGTISSSLNGGTHALSKVGTGTITLSNANNYSGVTTIDGGVLSIPDNSSLGSGNLINLNGRLFVTGNNAVFSQDIHLTGTSWLGVANTATFNGDISGDQILIKLHAGTAVLAGDNSYSGITSIENGILSITNGQNIGDGQIILSAAGPSNTGTLLITGSNAVLDNDIALASNGIIGASNSATLNGVISGAFNLTKIGAGTLVLNNSNNSYGGTTTISAGNLSITNQSNLGNTTAISLNGGLSVTGNNVTLTPTITLTGNSSLDVTNTVTFSNIAGTSTNTLTKTGVGHAILTNHGSFNSGLTVSDGRLSIANSIVGAVSLNGNLTTTGDNVTILGNLTLTGNSTLNVLNNATVNTLIGGNYSLTKTGAGKLTLPGNNTFSQTITVDQGILSFTNSGGLGNATAINALNSGSLDFSFNGTLANTTAINFNSTGNIGFNGTNAIVNNNITFANAISITGTGTGALMGVLSAGNVDLTKSGSGTVTLGGNNTYTGSTTINGGTLNIANANNLGTGQTIYLNGTLGITGTSVNLNKDVVLTGHSALNIANSATFNGVISGGFNLQKTGTGLLTSTGVNTYSGNTTVTAGTLSITNAQGLGTSPTINIQSGSTLDFAFNNATLTTSGNINIAGSGVGSNGALTFTGSNISLNNPTVLTAATSFGGTGSGSLNGIVSGAFNLTKVGSGSLTLGGNNTYGGTTSVNAGRLILNSLQSLGNSTSTTVQSGSALEVAVSDGSLSNQNVINLNGQGISNTGALVVNGNNVILNNNMTLTSAVTIGGSGSGTLGGIVSGNSTLVKVGTGSINLTRSNTYTGATGINDGTLIASHANALGTTGGNTTVNAGSSLVINNVAVSESIIVTGTGYNNAGALIGTGSNATVNSDVYFFGTDVVFSAPSSGDRLKFLMGVYQNLSFITNIFTQGAGELQFGSHIFGSGNFTTSYQGTTKIGGSSASFISIEITGDQTYNNPTTVDTIATSSNAILFYAKDITVNSDFMINQPYVYMSVEDFVINGTLTSPSSRILNRSLDIEASGDISGMGKVNSNDITLLAGGGISLLNTDNQITYMRSSALTNDIQINNNAPITIEYAQAVDNVSASTIVKNFTLNNTLGSNPSMITLNGSIFGGDITLVGNGITQKGGAFIASLNAGTLTLNSKNGTFTIGPFTSYIFTTGKINLIADAVNIVASTTQIGGLFNPARPNNAPTGSAAEINITPYSNNVTVGLGSNTGGTLAFSAQELNTLRGATIRIGDGTKPLGLVTISAFTPTRAQFASTALVIQNFTNGITQASGPFVMNTGSTLVLKGAGNVNLTNFDPNIAVSLSSGAFSLTDPSGTPVVVTSINDPVAGVINGITAPDGVTIVAAGALTLNQAITTQGNSNITLVTSKFTNNVGVNALNLGTGHYQIWSSNANPFNSNPAIGDVSGGLVHAYKQYNAVYGVSAVQGSGNGFLYTLAPQITPTLTGFVNKTYDGTTVVPLTNLTINGSGAIQNDVVTLGAASVSYDNKNVGVNKDVTATGITVSSASNNGVQIYGYQLATTNANAAVGSISARNLNITASGQNKLYDGTKSATVTLSDNRIAGDIFNRSFTSAEFADPQAGVNKLIQVMGINISGLDASNYSFNNMAITSGDILSLSTPSSNTNTNTNTGNNPNYTPPFTQTFNENTAQIVDEPLIIMNEAGESPISNTSLENIEIIKTESSSPHFCYVANKEEIFVADTMSCASDAKNQPMSEVR